MSSRILVVDDEESLRLIVSEVLLEEGHEVATAASAEEALRTFREQPFDIVITDIVMGGLSGLDLLDEVRRIDADTVVIIMTSHASVESTTRALRAGAYDFLTKPFDELEWIVAVAKRAEEKVALVRENRRLVRDLMSSAQELQKANVSLQTLADSLKDQADKDGLTGLFNHRYFREQLVRQISLVERSGETLSILFMDVDHFKHYNDTHGHLAGDQVLRQLAEMLTAELKSPAIVARYGGEELVALIPGLEKAAAIGVAESIRRLVEEFPFHGRESQPLGRVTLSIGVATYRDDGTETQQLINSADEALYQAKHRGRNLTAG
ncbi:MAG: diguanylate cyclase response regulator [Gemmatimonadota bacterium]|nr:MAG: diguanylate cyclase response regulator [Gemmatimonadota bacterium]